MERALQVVFPLDLYGTPCSIFQTALSVLGRQFLVARGWRRGRGHASTENQRNHVYMLYSTVHTVVELSSSFPSTLSPGLLCKVALLPKFFFAVCLYFIFTIVEYTTTTAITRNAVASQPYQCISTPLLLLLLLSLTHLRGLHAQYTHEGIAYIKRGEAKLSISQFWERYAMPQKVCPL